MTYLGGFPGTPRPDVNEQLAEEKHETEMEHARQMHIANEARPSWWKRLKVKFRGERG
jgi:hypothetical protein